MHSRGNFEGYVRAASPRKWLEVHGLEHWTEFYTPYGVTLQKRFFDYFLKGVESGWPDQPSVLLQVRTVDGFVERREKEWPLARTQWTRFYLDPANRHLTRDPVVTEGCVEYEPIGEGVTFITEQFETETEITGPAAAKMFVASSTTDADLFLVMRLFDPDGGEVLFTGATDLFIPLTQSWLRASHRKLDPELSTEYCPYHTHDELQPLTPGEVYGLDVEVWPTSIVIPPGYRLGLTIRGSDYENAGDGEKRMFLGKEIKGSGPFWHDEPRDRPLEIFGERVSVHAGGTKNSYLLLPVVPEQA
ncbi:MAG TPA: CocE/NonD family hydrolase C-terminal non-catalytic domain-containing protein [Spirochaetia bacterium]|nr:CocE/NonD family hydrolase C-terminal non-catalytic domain-containing protein [Spirochaetia bacterium]